jgi:putative tryptophan/tyrosine transport system substrate-binding protein
MRRREFFGVLGGVAATWPLAARGQQPNRIPVVGVLLSTGAHDQLAKTVIATFEKALQERGWVPGRNLEIQYRFGSGETDVTRAYARELIGMQPTAIFAISNTSMAALHSETSKVPIVFIAVSDPVGMGYVDSLSRPGRNVTGFTPFEPSLGSKWLSLLKEIAPTAEHIGVVFNPEPGNNSASFLQSIELAATPLGIKSIVTPRGDSADIERTIVALGKAPRGGVIFLPDALTYAHREAIVSLMAQQQLPAIYPWRDFVVAGGLMSYGPGVVGEDLRLAASYVDRILKGEKPADLPVQAPTTLAIVINAKTAKELGLEVPAKLITQADEVIE